MSTMTDGEIFDRFTGIVQDFIYQSGWQQLRPVQLCAARVLFEGRKNLLLSSSTASGKTEAAFFPIITMLTEHPSQSFGALYIAPMKSLINDQFQRLDALCDESGIAVWHWHGDVAASHKQKALKTPSGILQITPESLESMLMNRSNDVVRLFCDLRFIVIDEVHILTGSDRGNQILCQLARLQRLIGRVPVRVGLSATLGRLDLAAAWLGAGTDRDTEAPEFPDTRLAWKLGMEHFYIQNESADQTDPAGSDTESAAEGSSPPAEISTAPSENEEEKDGADADADENGGEENAGSRGRAELDAGYEYIYDCVKGKRCLVFSNSREETEYVTATLRQIAESRGEPDRFLIHHGNLSAALREEAEIKLRDDEEDVVACATVTMELGIDIAKLQRVVQLSSPHSVSSFLQRLGRSGRRGDPPEMMLVFREENPLPNTPLPQLIPWDLLRAIAIVQLYIEERYIEPPRIKTQPMSLLFHQTLSILCSSGALAPSALARQVLSLPPFEGVSREEYKVLLRSMLENGFIESTAEHELIVGLKGERLTSSFKFYAVFKDSEDYTVRCDSDEIGTITTPPPVGDRFALAGRVWEVTELDLPRRLIYVKAVKGKMQIEWPGDYGEVDTKILERMRRVLAEDRVYPYLKPNAAARLDRARAIARNTGMLLSPLVHIGGYSWCLFPWLGTRSFRTLRRLITKNSSALKISNMEYDGCYYMTFRMETNSPETALKHWDSLIASGIDVHSLVSPSEAPVFDKYDDFIPAELLRLAFAEDRLRAEELEKRGSLEAICREEE